jgi:hypothetical protein
MTNRPQDTRVEAWAKQREILARIGPEACFAIAIEMSDAIRAIQIEGARDRSPASSREAIVRDLVARQHRITLPERC